MISIQVAVFEWYKRPFMMSLKCKSFCILKFSSALLFMAFLMFGKAIYDVSKA